MGRQTLTLQMSCCHPINSIKALKIIQQTALSHVRHILVMGLYTKVKRPNK